MNDEKPEPRDRLRGLRCGPLLAAMAISRDFTMNCDTIIYQLTTVKDSFCGKVLNISSIRCMNDEKPEPRDRLRGVRCRPLHTVMGINHDFGTN
jgi:hypothetical protein